MSTARTATGKQKASSHAFKKQKVSSELVKLDASTARTATAKQKASLDAFETQKASLATATAK